MMVHVTLDIVNEPGIIAVLARAVEKAGMDLIADLAPRQVFVFVIVVSEVFFEGLFRWHALLLLGVLLEVLRDAQRLILGVGLKRLLQGGDLGQLLVELGFERLEFLLHRFYLRVTLAPLGHLPDVLVGRRSSLRLLV